MSKKLKLFVANRVGEIQSLTQPAQYRHVSREENPAGLVSRGFSIDQLKNNTRRLFAREFLKELQEKWPASKFKTTTNEAMKMKTGVRGKVTNHVVHAQLDK